MPSDDDALERLHAALVALAGDDAPALIEQARADARTRVRARLTDAWERALLAAAQQTLGAGDAAANPAPAASPTTEPSRADGETMVYVYGVVGAGAELGELVTGVDGRPPRTVVEADLAAVVGEVSAQDFDEERLRAHLADMTWVEMTARRHEEVLDAVCAATTVVPMRMCSVYSSEMGVRELLRRESAALHEALQALRAKTEWGVKVFYDGARSRRKPDAPEPASGAQYMQGRVREREAQAAAAGRVQDAVAHIHETLTPLAAESVILAPQRPQVSGRSADMVLNGVYLVPDDAAERFREQIRAIGAEFDALGLDVELTGPWPPYNFIPGTIGAGW